MECIKKIFACYLKIFEASIRLSAADTTHTPRRHKLYTRIKYEKVWLRAERGGCDGIVGRARLYYSLACAPHAQCEFLR